MLAAVAFAVRKACSESAVATDADTALVAPAAAEMAAFKAFSRHQETNNIIIGHDV